MRVIRFHQEDGFTLVELLITTTIMIILLAGVGGMIISGGKSSAAAHSLVQMDGDANDSLNTITRQIRVASHINPNSNNSQLSFSGDFGGDGVARTQTFLVENGYLVKDGHAWIEGVSALTFTYHFYNRMTKEEEVLIPGSYPGWNEQIQNIEVRIDMSRTSMGIKIDRTYYGSVTLMNALQ
jgi:type II secretory pathway pseudopilin PulG